MFKYKPWMREMSDEEMDSMITQYISTELQPFPNQLISLEMEAGLVHSMKVIVLCDRYNKGEWIVQALDLTLIRNLLNKYNQKHLEAFLLEQPNALLFAHFFLIAGYEACKE